MRTKVSKEEKEKEKEAALHRAATKYIERQHDEELKLVEQILINKEKLVEQPAAITVSKRPIKTLFDCSPTLQRVLKQ